MMCRDFLYTSLLGCRACAKIMYCAASAKVCCATVSLSFSALAWAGSCSSQHYSDGMHVQSYTKLLLTSTRCTCVL